MKNWFTHGGQNYAHYRPHYPLELSHYLSTLSPSHERAIDVGCGSGQLTRLLSVYFESVLGMDPSFDQLRHAVKQPSIQYQSALAEQLPINNQCADLITAAQAAHWFNLELFYSEVKRVLKPNGILALISYGVLRIESTTVNELFQQFYYQDIAPMWPPERRLVDEGYKTLPFPFTELNTPDLTIELEWGLMELIGYISTWSATKQALSENKEQLVNHFFTSLQHNWPKNNEKLLVKWPINLRVGKLLV
ncbi:MAG: class I SAM-dependent methyltransferase [Betaproteobacteria bacterium]|nr:class I SAM-dependent methyltransferase [Betaproteobacteria bacterium]MDE2056589.1 class I SAM-dependent methyltransferase [Betaproteobacteria bacterium]